MQKQTQPGSRDVARAAIEMSMSRSREEEQLIKKTLALEGVATAAADFGGEFLPSMIRIVERAVVAARREGLIGESHLEEGGVAGAAREALNQVTPKALGMSIGGKIGLARYNDHVAVAVFFGIGLGHLDEICVGLGHRAI
ncbi:MAG: hut operon positive regulator HutP [Clostridiales bacterium]|nr:hut operon positive regulator HutP [Clostridiales bacterium]